MVWDTKEINLRKKAIENLDPDNPRMRALLTDDEYKKMKVGFHRALDELEYPEKFIERLGHEAERKSEKGKTYEAYLNSPEWKAKRQGCLFYYQFRCAICYSQDNLEVHHRTYTRIFNEAPSDLVPLCQDCHKKYHGERE